MELWNWAEPSMETVFRVPLRPPTIRLA